MSDPTYRITTEHRPWEDPSLRWVAHIYRLSDEAWVHAVQRTTEPLAYDHAVEWITEQKSQQSGHTVYVDDDGRQVEAHSVKA